MSKNKRIFNMTDFYAGLAKQPIWYVGISCPQHDTHMIRVGLVKTVAEQFQEENRKYFSNGTLTVSWEIVL